MKVSFKLVAVVVALVVFLMSWANRSGMFEPMPYQDKGDVFPVTGAGNFPAGSIPVTCGIAVEKVYEFQVQEKTVNAEGWVWLVWPESFQELLVANAVPPGKVLVAVNAYESASVSLAAESPRQLPDGRIYQRYRFAGKFYAQHLDFRRFPFQTLEMPLIFGLNPDIAALSAAHAWLAADAMQSGLGEYTEIPGYVNTGMNLKQTVYELPAIFGLQGNRPPEDRKFSRVQMDIVYHTSTVAAILQIVLPLVVIMAIVLLAPNLAGSLWNVRTVIPPSLILALVIQEQSFRNKVPPLHYLTFMDQAYAISFGVALVIFALFVWASNQLDSATEANRREVVARINRVDLRFQIGLAVVMVVLIALAWFFPGPVR